MGDWWHGLGRVAPRNHCTREELPDTLGRSFDVTSDGQRLYVIKQPNPPDGSRVNVITNWRR